MNKIKKLILLTLCVLLCVGSLHAFAEDNLAYGDSFNASQMIEESSPFAVTEFTEYLKTIPYTQAQNILKDQQMLAMMLMDSYWTPEVQQAQVKAYTGVIKGYENGTYYNWEQKACTCHTTCKPESSYSDRCEKSNKEAGTCKRYAPTGSIQCKGFADMAFNQYKGANVSNNNAISTFPSYSNGSAGIESVKTFFKNTLTPGSNIRVHVRGATYNHSIIFGGLSADGSSFKAYHANGGSSKCQITFADMKISDFVNKYDYFIGAWKM